MPIQLIQGITINADPEKWPPSALAYIEQFRASVTPAIAALDNLINAYNTAEGDAPRIAALTALEQAADEMDRWCPRDVMVACPDYHTKIHHQLFSDIQREKASLGRLPAPETLDLSSYLAQMSPEKIDKLLSILMAPGFEQSQLTGLYDKGEPEKAAFDALLARYRITLMPNSKNSKNFTVFDERTKESTILKVENRMGQPQAAVDYLRAHSLQAAFTKDVSERHAECQNPETKKTERRILLFTEYVQGGSLDKKAIDRNKALKNLMASDVPDKVEKVDDMIEKNRNEALYEAIEMVSLLEKITEDGFVFTDLKNANWLIDDLGNLRIADKKGFAHLSEDGRWNMNDEKNKFYGKLVSPHTNAPEVETLSKETTDGISAEQMYAYAMGKNLYQLLTGCSTDAFLYGDGFPPSTHHTMRDFKGFDKSMACRRLLETLITPDTDPPRPRLRDLRESLAYEQYPELMQISFKFDPDDPAPMRDMIEAYQILRKIEHFSIASDDTLMATWVTEKKAALKNADTPEEVQAIKDSLEVTRQTLLQDGQQFLAIKNIIKEFEAHASSSMQHKGERITRAMLQVPVEERASIMSANTQEKRAVLNAMAEDTNFFSRMIQRVTQPRSQDTYAEPRNPAEVFVEFKEKFNKDASGEARDEQQENMSPNLPSN